MNTTAASMGNMNSEMALAELAARQADLVGEGGQEVRGVDGAAAGEYLHDGEVGERRR